MNFLFKEIAFGFLELESSLFELLEDYLNVFEMFLLILAENDDVIQIGNRKIATVLQKKLKLIIRNKQVPVLTRRELH